MVNNLALPLLGTWLLTAPLAAQGGAAEPPVTDRLLVLEKASGHLSILDPKAHVAVARVEVGTGPHEVAVAPDGRTAVVCNYGDRQPGNTLTIVDVLGARAVHTFALEQPDAPGKTFLRPHGIRFLADGRHVLVTSEQARRLLVVDIEARRVVHALPTAQSTLHMIAVASDGRRAFGSSLRDGTMSTFDLGALGLGTAPAQPAGTNTPAATILPTGDGAEGIDARPHSDEVWVANRAADTLSIVDGKAGKVVAELPTADLPIRVAFTPDGRSALVSCAEAGVVQVFDATTRSLAHTVTLLGDKTEQSPLPVGLCIDPDGRTAWVACGRGEFVAELDLQHHVVRDRIAVGNGPDGMAWARFAERTQR